MTLTDIKFEHLKTDYHIYLPYLSNLHEDFGGPSVYFHQQALIECSQNFLSNRHIEMIYATLSSWGMHRMGKTKTKMVSFDIFKSSVMKMASDLEELRFLNLTQFDYPPNDLLQRIQHICFRLQVSISNSKIVGNSKALAHIIPNLVPPIDRQYSIRFFAQKLANFKDTNEEASFYLHILQKCFELVQILKFDPHITIDNRFNSSLPKIFDNLLMIFLKKSTG